jgi:peptidyl-dipeptidase Dcp
MSAAIAAVALGSCSENNPFYGEYKTRHEAPPFDKIEMQHYLPAFEEGIRQQAEEVANIVSNAQEPTFANTIEALEWSGKLLDRVSAVFFNLNEAETSEEMDNIAEVVTPMVAKHTDDLLLNEGLFAKVRTVYDQRAALNLNVEQRKLLEETYKQFVRGGANLAPEAKAQLREINEKLASLMLKFGQNMLAETNAYKLVVDNRDDLEGLPKSATSAASNGQGLWEFTLKNPSVMPFLQYAARRDLRGQMLKEYANRANNGNANDNNAVIADIVSLRVQKAKLMGYETYADYVLDDCMAKTPRNVYNMLARLWTPALRKARHEARAQQALINRENGKAAFVLQDYDWRYYEQKIKQQSYDLDDEELRPYFPLDNVREGIFTLVEKLYGVQFTQVTDVPMYHKDVVCYGARDNNGDFLGLIYMDFFPRAGKRGGAWMTNFREQSYRHGKRVPPIISLVCNFSPATGSAPSLLTPDEVETFFHEFGHGLHSLLSNCQYQSLAGTNVARDFVELPSQIMENWAFEPELLALYAKRYDTREVIPPHLVDKIVRANQYGQGFKSVEYIAASWLDMDFHVVKDAAKIDVQQFERTSMNNIKMMSEILPRYRSTYFNHIFSGGYSAGYYSYIWAEVLDADAFQQFRKKGNIFDPNVATAFRKCILERGGTEEPMALYKRFSGHEPDITPLIKRRGLE